MPRRVNSRTVTYYITIGLNGSADVSHYPVHDFREPTSDLDNVLKSGTIWAEIKNKTRILNGAAAALKPFVKKAMDQKPGISEAEAWSAILVDIRSIKQLRNLDLPTPKSPGGSSDVFAQMEGSGNAFAQMVVENGQRAISFLNKHISCSGAWTARQNILSAILDTSRGAMSVAAAGRAFPGVKKTAIRLATKRRLSAFEEDDVNLW